MTDSSASDKGLSDLKFDGKKATFTSWKARFIAHLNALSTTHDYERSEKGQRPYHLAHSDWLKFQPIIDVDELAKSLKLDIAADAEALEAERLKRFYYLRMQESAIRGLLGKVLPNELLVQLQGAINNPDLPIHEVWKMMEREYGQSSLDVSTSLYLEFLTLPKKPFKSVSDLLKRMRSLQNQLNELYVKSVGEPLITVYQVSQALVAALPSEFFGSNVSQTKEGFKASVIETVVKQVFNTRSSEAIADMTASKRGSKREISVNQAKVNKTNKKAKKWQRSL
ncbi:hypothetical protein AeMF1_008948 [Aphanomyces euteiches]|nr:hypothetical protein AeMF1_008948 [Aphanomyces euteiches]